MKKAVITILGLIGHMDKVPVKIIDGKVEYKSKPKTIQQKAVYALEKGLELDITLSEQEKHLNMLTLLAQKKEIPIIAIGTEKAISIQKEALEYENISNKNIKFITIEEQEYSETLAIINQEIEKYESVIFDVSHGFRHLPILSIIALIIQNIKDINKVQNILFAKEKIPLKKYEIVDLKSYLEIANFSYILATFEKNYTLSNTGDFYNDKYLEVVDGLRILSGHILSNSLQQLFEKENILDKTIDNLTQLLEDDNIKTFKNLIFNINEHLTKIKELNKLSKSEQLLKMAKMMKERDYLLNSITLLYESLGFYCVGILASLDPKIKKHIHEYKKQNSESGYELTSYELTSQSLNIIKNPQKFTGSYLFDKSKKSTSGQKTSLQNKKKKLKEKLPENILNIIKNEGFEISLTQISTKKDSSIKDIILNKLEEKDFSQLQELIQNVKKLRDNLAHGNSSEKIDNIKTLLTKYMSDYDKERENFEKNSDY